MGVVGLWRAALQRSRADAGVGLAAWLLLICALTLVTASAVYADAVALGTVRTALLASPAQSRGVLVRSSVPIGDVHAVDLLVTAELERALAAAPGEVDMVSRSGAFAAVDVPAEDQGHLTQLASLAGIERHSTLVAGTWPTGGQDPVQATLSEAAAGGLGLRLGDRVALADRTDRTRVVRVVVVGVWRPAMDDPYWADAPLELSGSETIGRYTTRGPFVISPDDLAAHGSTLTLSLEWRAFPEVHRLAVDGVARLIAGLKDLPPRLSAGSTGRDITVSSGLPAILDRVDRSILVSRTGITLLFLEFGVLAGYAVMLLAGILADRRRPEVAILRSRGATSFHVAVLAAGEALLLVVPAGLLAPWFALGLVRLLADVGPVAGSGILADAGVRTGSLLVAAGASLVAVVVLTLPALLPHGVPAAIRAALGRQLAATLPQRLGLDIALVVVAGIALWQLRLYGAPLTRTSGGTLGTDPLLVAAPGIGLLAAGLMTARAIPRLAAVIEQVTRRGRGMTLTFGARQVARRPLRYTRSALLLMLAVALGAFSTIYSATWSRSQADQAAYAAAADDRVIVGTYPELAPWAAGSAYRGVTAVRQAMPVFRQTFSAGRAIRSGELLALDPAAAAETVTAAASATGTGIDAHLAGDWARTAALEIPGTPERLAVTIDADLGNLPGGAGSPVPLPDSAVYVAIVVEDADGLHRIDGGQAASRGRAQRLEVPLRQATGGHEFEPAWPLRLEAVELSVTAQPEQQIVGSVEIRGVAASGASMGDAWQPIPLQPSAAGWAWDRIEAGTILPFAPPAASPGRIVLSPGRGAGTTKPVASSRFYGGSTTIFRLWGGPQRTDVLPAMASSTFLQLTGARIGDSVAISAGGDVVRLRVEASSTLFPPLDPATPFVVVDARTLALLRYATWDEVAAPQEWWLSVEPGAGQAIAATLVAPPFSAASVTDRTSLERAMATDPAPLGVIGALALGSIAAVAIAAIGFLVSAAVASTERAGELALLEALGQSRTALLSSLVLESAALLGFGLLAGSAIGLALGWIVLPAATLTAAGRTPVPPPVIVVPWSSVGGLAVIAAALLILAAILLRSQVRRFDLARLLREGDR